MKPLLLMVYAREDLVWSLWDVGQGEVVEAVLE